MMCSCIHCKMKLILQTQTFKAGWNYFTLGTAFSSSHCLTPFFETIPNTRFLSAALRWRYRRIMYPQTLHTSSQLASNSSHQQFGGFEGRDISRNLVVRRIAALTIVGTAYSAYTGV